MTVIVSHIYPKYNLINVSTPFKTLLQKTIKTNILVHCKFEALH